MKHNISIEYLLNIQLNPVQYLKMDVEIIQTQVKIFLVDNK